MNPEVPAPKGERDRLTCSVVVENNAGDGAFLGAVVAGIVAGVAYMTSALVGKGRVPGAIVPIAASLGGYLGWKSERGHHTTITTCQD